MARLRQAEEPQRPAPSQDGSEMPDELVECFAEDWLKPDDYVRASDRARELPMAGVDAHLFYLQVWASLRWLRARAAWGREHGLEVGGLYMRPRWRGEPPRSRGAA